ncbi:hypothetical protein Goari_023451 [Gossypium aridum]|uniref:Uncharacterized protein n=1 Tax=Gossypium aridum TaxID=34290 RepID=A0A7J8X317_GOSAI|nr:hypothetical protein [Gossypium aridum]
MGILMLFFSFLMLMIYLTSVMVDTQIHIDSSIIDRNSPFYNDINGAGPMFKKMITLTKMENAGIIALLIVKEEVFVN